MLLQAWLRPKIDAIVSRGGGVPDRDAPLVLEETRYWITAEESKTDSSTLEFPVCKPNSHDVLSGF